VQDTYLADWVANLPEFNLGIRRRRQYAPDGHGNLLPVFPRAPNALPRIRAKHADLDQVIWDLQEAHKEVSRVAKMNLGEPAQSLTLNWQDQLWKLQVVDEQEHLFGSYLLTLCSEARAVEQEQLKLVARLSQNFTVFAKQIRIAANYLLIAGPLTLVNQVAEVSAEMTKGRWWREPAGSRPARFDKGPLRGTQKDLAKAICPHAGKEPDPRALQRLGATEVIWIERNCTQTYTVYFADQRLYSEANSSLLKLQDSKKGQKKRKS
jgi:hypothetical protein